jgi:hypothetical protein
LTWFIGQTCRAFAIRYKGVVYAYLNRCSHVPMEMDYQAGRFFDDTGAGCCVLPTARPMNLTPGCARAVLPRRVW